MIDPSEDLHNSVHLLGFSRKAKLAHENSQCREVVLAFYFQLAAESFQNFKVPLLIEAEELVDCVLAQPFSSEDGLGDTGSVVFDDSLINEVLDGLLKLEMLRCWDRGRTE